MGTDRELLEAAAKAAGFDSVIEMYGFNEFGEPLLDGNEPPTVWNPLTDDGDALRLAVKLRLEVVPLEGGGVDVIRWLNGLESVHVCESSTDEFAATRRAIVRAAAEIGRNMK